MIRFLLPLLLFFIPFFVLAQTEDDPFDGPPPRIVVQTGIGLQWFDRTYKISMLTIERPLGHYWYAGFYGGLYLSNEDDFFDNVSFKDGYDFGFFSKYFLHGRFSGRKSGLFLGPDIRFGKRRFDRAADIIFPPIPNPDTQSFEETTTKVLLRWGLQWQFKHATLEINAPFGWEFIKSNDPFDFVESEPSFIMMPTLQMGFAF